MRKFLIVFIGLFLIGCGGSSSSSDNSEVVQSNPVNTIDSTTKEAFFIQAKNPYPILDGKVYVDGKLVSFYENGYKYYFDSSEINLEIIDIAGGYGDVNRNNQLDTYEPIIRHMFTYNNLDFANPFTDFMVKSGYLSDTYTSFLNKLGIDSLEINSTQVDDKLKKAAMLMIFSSYFYSPYKQESDSTTTVTTVNNNVDNTQSNLPTLRYVQVENEYIEFYNALPDNATLNDFKNIIISLTNSDNDVIEALDFIENYSNSDIYSFELNLAKYLDKIDLDYYRNPGSYLEFDASEDDDSQTQLSDNYVPQSSGNLPTLKEE